MTWRGEVELCACPDKHQMIKDKGCSAEPEECKAPFTKWFLYREDGLAKGNCTCPEVGMEVKEVGSNKTPTCVKPSKHFM